MVYYNVYKHITERNYDLMNSYTLLTEILDRIVILLKSLNSVRKLNILKGNYFFSDSRIFIVYRYIYFSIFYYLLIFYISIFFIQFRLRYRGTVLTPLFLFFLSVRFKNCRCEFTFLSPRIHLFQFLLHSFLFLCP